MLFTVTLFVLLAAPAPAGIVATAFPVLRGIVVPTHIGASSTPAAKCIQLPHETDRYCYLYRLLRGKE